MTDLTCAVWRKSTRSGGNGGNCVEVATNLPGIIAVRDSKDADGPALAFDAEPWRHFLRALPFAKGSTTGHMASVSTRELRYLHS